MPLITDPIDWLLDPTTHDLVIENGDFVFVRGVAAVAQACKIALSLVEGEWFMDLDEGVPYFQRDTVPASRALIGSRFVAERAIAEFRKALLTIETVSRIVSLTTEFARASRTVTVRFQVLTVFGDTVSDTLERTV